MTCVIDERATPTPLSNRIKVARLACGLSQQDLAGRVGVAVASVSRWERGISRPFPRQLAKLAEATEQDLSYFADEDEAARPRHGSPTDISHALDWLEHVLSLARLGAVAHAKAGTTDAIGSEA